MQANGSRSIGQFRHGVLAMVCMVVFSAQARSQDPEQQAAGQAPANAALLAPAKPIKYGRDIQPLLSETCFRCHGPDAKKREADLRLDTLEGATQSGAIVPGDSAASEMIRRIITDNPDERMPPADSNVTLSAEQVALLRRWIDEGAVYTPHWSFTPLVRPEIPTPPEGAIVHNTIDAFIAARLAEEGLPQAPEADPAKLLRRVTLDLTGLPPTPEELDAFLADPSALAYEDAVDRLLANGRFGERMVWEWLEAARYADTNGYQGDPTRSMWYWRDWAIAAFNQNLPYDQFTIQQIAGDLLPDPTQDQLVATGFHRNHMINGEGGRISEESRVEYVQDRVETTGTVWLGITLTCCRCHDHKYDPFTQKEYYQLAAYFNSLEESGANDAGGLANPVMLLANDEQNARLQELRTQEQAQATAAAAAEEQAKSEQLAWETTLQASTASMGSVSWQPLVPAEVTGEAGTTFTVDADGVVLAAGPAVETDAYVVSIPNALIGVTAFKLEVLPDASLPASGPGRADNGNFVLTELTLQASGKPSALEVVYQDYFQPSLEGAKATDGNPGTGWAVAEEFGKPHELILVPKEKIGEGWEKQLSFRLEFDFGSRHAIGKFRLWATTDNASLVRPMPEAVMAAVVKPAADRTPEEQQQLTQYYLDTHAAVATARRTKDESRRAREDYERGLPRTMVMRDRAEPRATTVLIKGAYNAPGETVEHGVLASLLPLSAEAPKNRLALANWLVSKEHPLTARVTINRFWQQFFGIGFVKTAEDFGLQGDRPSNQDLLDFLAAEFRDGGWNVKALVRQMVTSHAYRQSSKVSPELHERDPDNRLLARGPRYRLPSWMIRDQALFTSGLLVEQVGGPPVKGYQPPGVWEDATFGQIGYQQDHGEALYRRSLYTFWRRIVAPTMFFDVANRQNCTVRTARTNTPLHALVTLNDVTFAEAARALAQRTLLAPPAGATATTEPASSEPASSEPASSAPASSEPPGEFSSSPELDQARLQTLFRRVTCRALRPAEFDRLHSRLLRLREAYTQAPALAAEVLTVGESPADPRIPPAELAAWTGIASLVLNLDEVISQE